MKTSSIIWGLTLVVSQIGSGVTTTDGVNLGSSNSVPAGSNSIASGTGNTATGGSIAIGNGNSAENYSIALGDGSLAAGGSISCGGWNTIDANSYYMAALGEGNYSGYSEGSALLGTYNSMGLQWGSAAIGNSNEIRFPFGKGGIGNVLLGQLNRIDATVASAPNDLQGTVLVGTDNESSSTMAFAFGKGNIGQTDTVTIGTYAATVPDASLIVGKGTGSMARSNGLVVLRNGEVQVPGSLVVGGSPTLTQGTAPSFMEGQGFVNTTYLSSNGYLTKSYGGGALTNGALISIGQGSTADSPDSIALGNSSNASSGGIAIGWSSMAMGCGAAIQGGVATGQWSFATTFGSAVGAYSVAMGGASAHGDQSISLGGYNVESSGSNTAIGKNSSAIGGSESMAIGDYSFSTGYQTCAYSKHSTAIGSKNLSSQNLLPISNNAPTEWVETEALFELGNGDPLVQVASNAITTLKNGQTTVTNKAWKANSTAPLADPEPTTDSGGEALVVEGHTRLKGKVIIEQAQGDISMGIYGGQ